MSINIETFDTDGTEHYCFGCEVRRSVVASIKKEGLVIFLCEDCLNQLKKDIDKVTEDVSKQCFHCVNFLGAYWDWFTGEGRCKLDNKAVYRSNTCDKFELNKSNKIELLPLPKG